MTFLPFHCPTFRTDHLLDPCKTNLARVKAMKVAKKHIGPLEKCVECKGKMLITVPRVVIEGLPAPESWVEKRFVEPEPPKYVSPERKGWEPTPEVTTAPLFLKDVPVPAENRLLSPEKIAAGRKAGHNLGKKYKTRKVLLEEEPHLSLEKEEIYSRIMAQQEEIAPELPKKQEEIVPAVKLTEKEAVKLGIVPPPEAQEARYCKTHPEAPQKQDKLGRWMGMCAECVSIRGQKCGEQNFERGVTAPPMSIPLNLPKYAELKAWLEDQAEEGERKLIQQIMFVLKMAWKQGAP